MSHQHVRPTVFNLIILHFHTLILQHMAGAFQSVEVAFELETGLTDDPPQFSLTCISEGGPATNVQWEREGDDIVDDANHSFSQIVVDAVEAIYHNILVVTGRYDGEYTCMVSHSRTSFSDSIIIEGKVISSELKNCRN